MEAPSVFGLQLLNRTSQLTFLDLLRRILYGTGGNTLSASVMTASTGRILASVLGILESHTVSHLPQIRHDRCSSSWDNSENFVAGSFHDMRMSRKGVSDPGE